VALRPELTKQAKMSGQPIVARYKPSPPYSLDLNRLLVVFLDQSRPDNAQLARPFCSARNKLLIGHAVEGASRANLAPVDDLPRDPGHRNNG
jgi:hypothetical protein